MPPATAAWVALTAASKACLRAFIPALVGPPTRATATPPDKKHRSHWPGRPLTRVKAGGIDRRQSQRMDGAAMPPGARPAAGAARLDANGGARLYDDVVVRVAEAGT